LRRFFYCAASPYSVYLIPTGSCKPIGLEGKAGRNSGAQVARGQVRGRPARNRIGLRGQRLVHWPTR